MPSRPGPATGEGDPRVLVLGYLGTDPCVEALHRLVRDAEAVPGRWLEVFSGFVPAVSAELLAGAATRAVEECPTLAGPWLVAALCEATVAGGDRRRVEDALVRGCALASAAPGFADVVRTVAAHARKLPPERRAWFAPSLRAVADADPRVAPRLSFALADLERTSAPAGG